VMSARGPVRFEVHKGRCDRVCASAAVTGWTQPAAAGSTTIAISRRLGGRTLKRGRYTLTASAGGVRAVTFTVR
jgi:hypothetical protein